MDSTRNRHIVIRTKTSHVLHKPKPQPLPSPLFANNLPSNMGLLNYVFLIHGLVETAVGLIYLFLTENVPVTSLDQPTTLWSLKFFGATMLSLSIPALLCSSLPDMLPGKRALGTRRPHHLPHSSRGYVLPDAWPGRRHCPVVRLLHRDRLLLAARIHGRPVLGMAAVHRGAGENVHKAAEEGKREEQLSVEFRRREGVGGVNFRLLTICVCAFASLLYIYWLLLVACFQWNFLLSLVLNAQRSCLRPSSDSSRLPKVILDIRLVGYATCRDHKAPQGAIGHSSCDEG
ncbi:hypothetical protein BC938DRAFT_471971 [Jimgerdemannia flammicorona]|uniref:Uncharacterized protein n=1 Tax=Jimgerdemannia flammicorona TaxID=994334 RepID=A0A433Q6Z6_9FUNG|nr:hypothetical protein BC938DRAFT_471971 [Jimgerdemannia flammicorona]